MTASDTATHPVAERSTPPWIQRIERFFYTEEIPYGSAAMRMMLPAVLLAFLVPRWFVCREIYSTDGATAPLADGFGYYQFLPEFSGPVVACGFTILLFSLVCALIGFCTRPAIITALGLFWYFCMIDSVSTMSKHTVIASHLLLLLSLSRCDTVWSVDAWLAQRRRLSAGVPPLETPERFPVWPRRLVQLFMGIVYLGASLTKMHTPAFFSGDQLQFWMLTRINLDHPLGELFALYPLILSFFAYITIVWEVAFIFAVWKGIARTAFLALGVMFHAMTAISFGLLIFPMVCFSSYLSFLDEEDIAGFRETIGRWFARWPGLAALVQFIRQTTERGLNGLATAVQRLGSVPATWAVATLMVGFLGVVAEDRYDIYGHHDGVRPQLVPIEQSLASAMLAPRQRLAEEEKFFSVQLGTLLVGEQLGDRRSQFRAGQTLIVQANLTPPHEDMAVECNIVDADQHIVLRADHIVTREMFRCNFSFPICNANEPGEYAVVMKSGGREVMRRRFEIVGAPSASTAQAN